MSMCVSRGRAIAMEATGADAFARPVAVTVRAAVEDGASAEAFVEQRVEVGDVV
jgi:hypothetical protein